MLLFLYWWIRERERENTEVEKQAKKEPEQKKKCNSNRFNRANEIMSSKTNTRIFGDIIIFFSFMQFVCFKSWLFSSLRRFLRYSTNIKFYNSIKNSIRKRKKRNIWFLKIPRYLRKTTKPNYMNQNNTYILGTNTKKHF